LNEAVTDVGVKGVDISCLIKIEGTNVTITARFGFSFRLIKNMKAKELIELGFKKVIVSAEESGGKKFYYFNYDFSEGGFCLISTSNDFGAKILDEDEEFAVEVFNENDFLFTDIEEVKLLINILKRNKKL